MRTETTVVFSTHLFIFYFLPVVLLFTYTVRFRYLSLGLTLLSYVFYGWANPPWVLLMLFTSYVDYFCGLALAKSAGLKAEGSQFPRLPKGTARTPLQKVILGVSLASNLSILGFFKYYDFAITNVNAALLSLGLGDQLFGLLNIALPVGISFYTFESMSYAFDVYRGDARAMKNPIDYQFFVADFPHLVAGPIIRYQTIADQIRFRTFTYEKFARGVAFFCLGMAKKILLANPMGHIADNAFSAAGLYWYDAWYGLLGYAFQIYFDFSAYSDMAVGLGLMIGLLFMKNFDDPYKADSITDFWRRWHISLSTWLRDYLYISLGGNRKGKVRTYINLMVVMLIGGMWHGASWSFLIWGAIHGGMLAWERMQGKRSFYFLLPRTLRVAVTFLVVCLSWVFFRAETLSRAITYLKSLFGLVTPNWASKMVAGPIYTPYHVLTFVCCAILVWKAPQVWTFTQRLTLPRACLCLGLFVVSLVFMWTQSVNPFLYFQF